jgi:acetyl esterase/lipase
MKTPYLIALVLAVATVTLIGVMLSAPVATLNAITPSNTYSLRSDLAYGPLARHKLDVYTPASAAPPGGWPVVVFFYGGAWNRGERAQYRFVGEALASRGVLTLLADYRLYPQVRYPDFLSDSAQALAFGLREAAHLGGNPARVFVMGHSAGAYNAAMLALDARWLASTGHTPSELAGWVGLAGPYDFLPVTNPDAKPVFNHPNYPAGTQPVDYAAHSTLPAFLAAATPDDLVNPKRNTLGLATRLQGAQVPVSLHLYDGVNHMTLVAALARPLRWLAPVLDDVMVFISSHTAGRG